MGYSFSTLYFSSAYHVSKRIPKLKNMRFVAFDSFQGLPDIETVDSEIRDFNKGSHNCDVNQFKKNLLSNQVDLDRVIIVPGWYEDSLNKGTTKEYDLRIPSVVLIDCDLYSSARSVMNFLTDYVRQGTILLFDDWFHFRASPNHGEQLAVREWLDENPQISLTEYYKFDHNGNSFIVNINDGV